MLLEIDTLRIDTDTFPGDKLAPRYSNSIGGKTIVRSMDCGCCDKKIDGSSFRFMLVDVRNKWHHIHKHCGQASWQASINEYFANIRKDTKPDRMLELEKRVERLEAVLKNSGLDV